MPFNPWRLYKNLSAHQPNHHSLQSALLFAHTFMTKVVMRKNLQKLEKERQRNKIHANISNRNYHLPVAMERKKVLLDRETDKMKVKAVISKFWYRSNGKKGVWPIKHAVNIQPINLRDFNHRQKEALMETRKKKSLR